jgi:hypothetical protein
MHVSVAFTALLDKPGATDTATFPLADVTTGFGRMQELLSRVNTGTVISRKCFEKGQKVVQWE